MIRTILRDALHNWARALNVHPSELCIVGHTVLVRDLRKISIRAEAIPGIPTHDMGGGRFLSDVHIIPHRDLWAWRGRGMRAKILRGLNEHCEAGQDA